MTQTQNTQIICLSNNYLIGFRILQYLHKYFENRFLGINFIIILYLIKILFAIGKNSINVVVCIEHLRQCLFAMHCSEFRPE